MIGLDGYPCSLLSDQIARAALPRLSNLLRESLPVRMESVYPTVSGVAWATYMTGRNPGNHRIFGFIDRKYKPFQLVIPDSRHIGCRTLWTLLGESGHPIIVVNVPLTYPPRQVNGILVGGFLCPDIARVAYPPAITESLKRSGYIIDAETGYGVSGQWNSFLDHLETTLERRIAAFIGLIDHHEWSFAQLHIMETDRLFHYLWKAVERDFDPGITGRVDQFFKLLDGLLDTLISRLDSGDELILLSDHGFCRATHAVQLNRLLQETGFLDARDSQPVGHDEPPGGYAYSLMPGRIFMNLKNREPWGRTEPDRRDEILNRITSLLSSIKIPGTDRCAFKRICRSAELYRGNYLSEAADLIVVPERGVELRASYAAGAVFETSKLQGIHTFDDAFVWIKNRRVIHDRPNIIDLYPSILEIFAMSDPEAEGSSLFH
ncbi:alkaline phosphatase family protein [bacterium]|nr:alkaline phosphatase family protein [candidate division CSSED10-310 bacterium]